MDYGRPAESQQDRQGNLRRGDGPECKWSTQFGASALPQSRIRLSHHTKIGNARATPIIQNAAGGIGVNSPVRFQCRYRSPNITAKYPNNCQEVWRVVQTAT